LIVSSVLFQDAHEQKDGTRYVGELHTDSTGTVHRFEYLATQAMMANRDAVMAARASRLEERLAEEEAKSAIEVDAAPVLNHQTGTQFLQRLREFYRNAGKERCARIARWIINRLDAGHVTAAQLRNVFDLTVQQWNTLEAKLRSLKASVEAVDAAAGE